MTKARTITDRILSSARRSAGTDRGWHDIADRDTERTSFDVMLLSQIRQNDR